MNISHQRQYPGPYTPWGTVFLFHCDGADFHFETAGPHSQLLAVLPGTEARTHSTWVIGHDDVSEGLVLYQPTLVALDYHNPEIANTLRAYIKLLQ